MLLHNNGLFHWHTYLYVLYIYTSHIWWSPDGKQIIGCGSKEGREVCSVCRSPCSTLSWAWIIHYPRFTGQRGAVLSQLSDLTVSVSRCREGRSQLFFFDSVQQEVTSDLSQCWAEGIPPTAPNHLYTNDITRPLRRKTNEPLTVQGEVCQVTSSLRLYLP